MAASLGLTGTGFALRLGLEPRRLSLTGSCSAKLSYRRLAGLGVEPSYLWL